MRLYPALYAVSQVPFGFAGSARSVHRSVCIIGHTYRMCPQLRLHSGCRRPMSERMLATTSHSPCGGSPIHNELVTASMNRSKLGEDDHQLLRCSIQDLYIYPHARAMSSTSRLRSSTRNIAWSLSNDCCRKHAASTRRTNPRSFTGDCARVIEHGPLRGLCNLRYTAVSSDSVGSHVGHAPATS